MTEFEAEVIARLDRIEQALGGALQRRDGATPPRAASSSGDRFVMVKFGRDKGKPIYDVDDLSWYRGAIARSVADPAKGQYLTANQADLAAIDDEIARRAGGGAPAPAPAALPFPEADDVPF